MILWIQRCLWPLHLHMSARRETSLISGPTFVVESPAQQSAMCDRLVDSHKQPILFLSCLLAQFAEISAALTNSEVLQGRRYSVCAVRLVSLPRGLFGLDPSTGSIIYFLADPYTENLRHACCCARVFVSVCRSRNLKMLSCACRGSRNLARGDSSAG